MAVLVGLSELISARVAIAVTRVDFPTRQEKRVDKATLEMEPEYPARYFDDLATDLCTSKAAQIELATADPETRCRFQFESAVW